MAETQQGYKQSYNELGSLSWSGSPTNYASPLMQSFRASFSTDERQIKNAAGQVVGTLYPEDWVIELTFEYVLAHASNATYAELTGSLPTAGLAVTVSGMPTMTFGGVADVLNAGGGAWIFVSGAVNATNDGPATGTMTLKKYKNITAA